MSKTNSSYELVILVVEDEFLIRDSIVEYLRAAGCLVLEAQSGEQALEILDADRPIDVVFTDIQLSGDLNGWDVARACRHIWSDIAIVYTSGQTRPNGQSVSGSIFIDKPYGLEQVFNTCRSLCNGGSPPPNPV